MSRTTSATANDWLTLAEENAAAGEQLRSRERLRASTSRYYYAAYQAAHALLFTTPLKSTVPMKGNWDHSPLMNAVKDGAIRHFKFEERAAEQLRRRLRAAMDARIIADYGAGFDLDEGSFFDAQRAANDFITLAYSKGAKGK